MQPACNVSAPRPSATVVLLRDSATGPEVLLVLRHERASFGASYVFPGGVIEDDDSAVHERCADICDSVASRRLGLDAGGLDFYSAAIRELFEETGILLAHRAVAEEAGVPVCDNDCETERSRLNAGELGWRNFLDEQHLLPACDALHYFAFWVTPRVFPKRFSTRFFMATLPDGQVACHDGGELTDSCWMKPQEALAAAARDAMLLPPPTRATLQDLTTFDSVQEALAFAKQRERQGVACILPAILGSPDAQRIVLPGSPDYPADHQGLQE